MALQVISTDERNIQREKWGATAAGLNGAILGRKGQSPFDVRTDFFGKGNDIRSIPGNHPAGSVYEELFEIVQDLFFSMVLGP